MHTRQKVDSVIWKTKDGKERLEAHYDAFLQNLGPEVAFRMAKTRFGNSQLLVMGPEGAPPIICLHAMRTGAPFLLSELKPLASNARLFVPDLPGQSLHGINTRFSLKDDTHADWLVDVMDDLGIKTAGIFGVSWGGWIARVMANLHPERLTGLALLVPAGIVNGSHFKSMFKMLIPFARYKVSPTRANLKSLLAPLLTTYDERWLDFIETALADWKFDSRIPPLATDEQLRSIEIPTLAIGAEDDISFPGGPLVDRVSRLVPHSRTELVKGCKHCPPTTPEFQNWLSTQLSDFFSKSM